MLHIVTKYNSVSLLKTPFLLLFACFYMSLSNFSRCKKKNRWRPKRLLFLHFRFLRKVCMSMYMYTTTENPRLLISKSCMFLLHICSKICFKLIKLYLWSTFVIQLPGILVLVLLIVAIIRSQDLWCIVIKKLHLFCTNLKSINAFLSDSEAFTC